MTFPLPRPDVARATSRRAFLTGAARNGATAALATALPAHAARAWSASVRRGEHLVGLPPGPVRVRTAALVDPTGVRALALRAIDAAKAAGAEYADVRLTRLVRQELVVVGLTGPPLRNEVLSGVNDGPPSDTELLAVGVRALAGGGWGFAASPVWDLGEMARLAAEAVAQAKANGRATPRRVELARTPVVTGSWRAPGAVDPFAIPPEEKLEALRAAVDYAASHAVPIRRGREDRVGATSALGFAREEWALATSEGTYVTQERFTTTDILFQAGTSYSAVDSSGWSSGGSGRPIDYPTDVSGGWEVFDAVLVRRRLDEVIDEYFARGFEAPPPRRPVDVGRYEVVCSPGAAAELAGQLFGAPCELDRAMGFEANAGGTSYLDDPLAMLGTLKLGTDALTVTADRSTPGGLATVKWDDEGVEPQAVTLVKNGVLTDLLTTRETATWLAPYYAKSGRPVRSGGAAAAESALSFSLAHPPNLTLTPGPEADVDFDALVRDTKKGIAFLDGCVVKTDYQGRTGLCCDVRNSPVVREIVNGRLGAVLDGAALSFDSTKLWNTLVALGGAKGAKAVGATSTKGEPAGTTRYTVTAPALKFKEGTVIDARRRA